MKFLKGKTPEEILVLGLIHGALISIIAGIILWLIIYITR